MAVPILSNRGTLFTACQAFIASPLAPSSVLILQNRPRVVRSFNGLSLSRTKGLSSRLADTSIATQRTMSTSSLTNDGSTAPSRSQQPIVQYIVLRRDLDWPAGAMAAQAAHASVAAIAQGLESKHLQTKQYISSENIPHMTKYVYGVDTLEDLKAVREKWDVFLTKQEDDSQQQQYYWWVEQPENIPTALATWPIERTNKVSKAVKKMNLSFF